MAGSTVWFAQAVLALATTYLMHSTILLGGVWLLVRLSRTSSYTLEEKLWKLAALLGLLTAPLQLSLGWPTQWDVVFSPGRTTAVAAAAAPPVKIPDAASINAPPQDAAAETTSASPPRRFAVFAEGVAAGREINSRADTRIEVSLLGFTELGDDLSQAASSPDAENAKPLPISSSLGARLDLAPGAILLGALVVIVFMAGGFVLVIIQSRWLCHRFVGARALDSGPARRTLERLLKRHAHHRRVRLLSADTCQEPVVFGVMRWTIVLPANSDKRLCKDELRALLAHELAHLVRGDLWWLWIGRLLCACLAFQPLNFLARRRWRQATEYLCDEWALQCGVTGLSLARCLTRIAQWRLDGDEGLTTLAAGGSKSTLIHRVERLVEQRGTVDAWSSPQRRRRFALLASLVTVTFFAVAPRIGLPSPSGSNQVISARENSLVVATLPNDGPVESCDWGLLDEELRGLDTDLIRANSLLDQIPQDRHLRQITADLRRHAQQIRERRKRFGSLMEKDSE